MERAPAGGLGAGSSPVVGVLAVDVLAVRWTWRGDLLGAHVCVGCVLLSCQTFGMGLCAGGCAVGVNVFGAGGWRWGAVAALAGVGSFGWRLARFTFVLFVKYEDSCAKSSVVDSPAESTLMRWNGLLVALEMKRLIRMKGSLESLRALAMSSSTKAECHSRAECLPCLILAFSYLQTASTAFWSLGEGE